MCARRQTIHETQNTLQLVCLLVLGAFTANLLAVAFLIHANGRIAAVQAQRERPSRSPTSCGWKPTGWADWCGPTPPRPIPVTCSITTTSRRCVPAKNLSQPACQLHCTGMRSSPATVRTVCRPMVPRSRWPIACGLWVAASGNRRCCSASSTSATQ